jgi:uncharacterized protein (TIGR02001 family)
MLYKKTIKALLAVFALLGVINVSHAESPLTGNIGFNSNYIWRGVTQTGDDSAISGGVDYAHASGFYAGTWVSSLGGSNYENDLYAGYGFKYKEIGLDVGYIAYRYPVGNNNADFSEIYVNASFKMLGFGMAYTIDKDAAGPDNDIYLYIGADFEIAKDLNLNLLYGSYDYDNGAIEDYAHIHASLSKDEFTFAIDDNDLQGAAGDTRISVSYSKTFDLM